MTMSHWTFSFLGGVEATCGTVRVNDLTGKKAGAVLALLALSPGRARPREDIINLLWPEVDFDEARDRFKQQLALLRKILEPKGVAPGSVLVTNRNQAGIAWGHQSDVALFQDRLRQAASAAEPEARTQRLREALTLYKGEFAPGFYVDVLLSERERLAALAESAKARLQALEAEDAPRPPAKFTVAIPSWSVHTQNRFFGREQERKQIPQMLEQNRLVTILGPGGTGKTRLVEELLPEMPRARLVLLSAVRSGAAIFDTIVTSLSLPHSSQNAIQRLQDAFKNKPTLLVLDNMEQLAESGGAEAVAELLETIPTLRLLVTSRIKLNLPQECVYTLAPLPQSDAVQLFVNRARLARSSFTSTPENEEAIAQLCRRLDGLPLAIELAATRIAILTPAQILERLNRRFDLLNDRRRDRQERHTSLRAALDWGWGLLCPDVQMYFAQLCVFQGSFSLEAAETVTGELLAIDHLQYLADTSFLIVENQEGSLRFRLLETLREYGREKWRADTAETLLKRHSGFFLERAKQWEGQLHGEKFAETMALFKQDYDNFVAAVDESLVSNPLCALELCQHLDSFWDYAYLKREALRYQNAALRAVQVGGLSDALDNRQWASLHDNIASAYRGVYNYGSADEHFREALSYHDKRLSVAAGEENTLARKARAGTLHNLANNLYCEKRLEEAQSNYAEAATLNRAIGNQAWLANNLNGLCHICVSRAYETDNLDRRTMLLEQGLAYAQEAVAISRALPQKFYLCYMLLAQSGALLALECDSEVLAVLAELFTLATELEHWVIVAESLVQYHQLAFRSKQWEVAAQLLGRIAKLSQQWELDLNTGQSPHLIITDSQRTVLTTTLGLESYNDLYQRGFQMSLEALPSLVAVLSLPNSPRP